MKYEWVYLSCHISASTIYAKDSQTKICKDIKNENTLACIHKNSYSNQTEMYMCYGLQFPPNLWCTENVFEEIQKYTYNQKWFGHNIQKIHFKMGRDIICHAIWHHPPSITNIWKQKRCENKNIKTDRAISSFRCA